MRERRTYSPELYAEVRAKYAAGGVSLRQLAEAYNIPVGTIQNMACGRTRSSAEAIAAARAERARAVSALGGEAVRRQHAEQRPPVGVVAAAIAERSTGKPLVVETLEARLEREVPGAIIVHDGHSALASWVVTRRCVTLAKAHSKREAVDIAVSLWGGR